MKKQFLLLLLLIAFLLTTGCSAKKETDSSGDTKPEKPKTESVDKNDKEVAENVELTMWTFLDPYSSPTGRALALKKIIEKFESTNPGITVKVEPQDHSTLPAKVYAAFSAGNAPDVFQVSVGSLGTGIEMGAISTLESLFYNDWTEEEKADIASSVWENGADENGHYQVALFGGAYGILYRADLFEKFNIDVESIKLWDDLYEAAKTLTYVNEDGLQVYGLGIGYATSVTDFNGILPCVLLNQEGGVFTEDGYPNNWTGELAQKALRKQIEAVEIGITPESCVSMDYEDVLNAFAAGQFAMCFAPTLRIPQVMAAASFDPSYIKFLPYPELEEGLGNDTFSGGWYTCVCSASPYQEAAGKFLEYLCSSEADEIWVTVADQIPLRKSTLNKLKDYISKPGNEWLATATELKKTAYVSPENIVTTGMQMDFQNAFIRAFSEGYTIEDALKSIEEDFIARNCSR